MFQSFERSFYFDKYVSVCKQIFLNLNNNNMVIFFLAIFVCLFLWTFPEIHCQIHLFQLNLKKIIRKGKSVEIEKNLFTYIIVIRLFWSKLIQKNFFILLFSKENNILNSDLIGWRQLYFFNGNKTKEKNFCFFRLNNPTNNNNVFEEGYY